MDTKGLQKEFINWCKSKNKQPKSEDETKQLFVAFMKEKHPEEYKAATENKEKYPEEYAKIQEAQKQKTTIALHGAKLNYFKSLKHQCAEDEEVVYYKKGGSVTCGCKKKEEGGEVKKAGLGCSAVERFKSIKKAGFGDVLIKIADSLSGGGFRKAEEEKRKRTISSVKKGPGTTKQPTINGTKKMQEENKKKFKNDYSSKRVKDSEEDYLKGKTNEATAEKCGGKVKKHLLGGSTGPATREAAEDRYGIKGYFRADNKTRGIINNQWKARLEKAKKLKQFRDTLGVVGHPDDEQQPVDWSPIPGLKPVEFDLSKIKRRK